MHGIKRVAVLLLALACLSRVHAANVIWPAVVQGSSSTYNGVYSGTLNSLIPDYIVGVWFDISGTGGNTYNMAASGGTAATGFFMYQTSYEAPIHATAFASSEPFAENLTPTLGDVQIVTGQIYYLAFWMGDEGVGGVGSIYGWVECVWNGTRLIVLDSAAETTGVGIYAGTYTPMPEPSAAGLALAGLAALALRRRRRTGKRPGGS